MFWRELLKFLGNSLRRSDFGGGVPPRGGSRARLGGWRPLGALNRSLIYCKICTPRPSGMDPSHPLTYHRVNSAFTKTACAAEAVVWVPDWEVVVCFVVCEFAIITTETIFAMSSMQVLTIHSRVLSSFAFVCLS